MNVLEGLDQSIANAEAEVARLKAKREEAARFPAEPTGYGVTIKQPMMVPAFATRNGEWSYVTSPTQSRTWASLMKYGGRDFAVLSGVDNR